MKLLRKLSSIAMARKSSAVKVSPNSSKPDKEWKLISKNQRTTPAPFMSLDTPIKPDFVRFVCIADTHSDTHRWPWKIPNGDVFIHAGDFCLNGTPRETDEFNDFLGVVFVEGELPHPHKIVIAGNHDLIFDPDYVATVCAAPCYRDMRPKVVQQYLSKRNLTKPHELLSNCTYLQDASLTIYGINIYGSPWIPYNVGGAFSAERGQEILTRWDAIPDDTDVLITHGPPLGYGDLIPNGMHVGCVELLHTVQKRVKPKYHIFGHIHEGYEASGDGTTVFINTSTTSDMWDTYNPPVLFDLPLPPGIAKI